MDGIFRSLSNQTRLPVGLNRFSTYDKICLRAADIYPPLMPGYRSEAAV